ncbi:MAG: type II toxin-antitoxin system RelE/ParE family toxin [Hyphomicrobiales bacterium]
MAIPRCGSTGLDGSTEIPYKRGVHTVIETNAFVKAADEAGLSEAEREAIVTAVAELPDLGDPIIGTGGCRKFRFAGRSKGKSGGYRIIAFYTGQNIPVFLITVFGKGEKADLSKAEKNQLKSMAAALADGLVRAIYGSRRR